MRIEGKTALVTGGANGIGFNIVRQLLKRGAKSVVILDIDENGGNDAQKNLGNEFGQNRVIFFRCDVTKSEEFQGTFKKALELVGKLDIFVNNSGILNEDDWVRMIDINFKAVVEGTKLAIDHMGNSRSNEGKIIVNIASTAAFPSAVKGKSKLSVYCGTKHAILGFSFSIEELCNEKGIGLLIICPSSVDTNLLRTNLSIFPQEKLAGIIKQTPEHVATSIIDLIEKGEKKAVWVIENQEPPYALEFPKYSQFKV